MPSKGYKKPKCRYGHPIAGENVSAQGHCRKCDYRRQKEWAKLNPYREKEQNKKTAAKVYRQRREYVNSVKNCPCQDCGIQYPSYVMQFDHRNPLSKSFGIGAGVTRRSMQALKDEIAKCDIICANCHAERTHRLIREKRKCER